MAYLQVMTFVARLILHALRGRTGRGQLIVRLGAVGPNSGRGPARDKQAVGDALWDKKRTAAESPLARRGQETGEQRGSSERTCAACLTFSLLLQDLLLELAGACLVLFLAPSL